MLASKPSSISLPRSGPRFGLPMNSGVTAGVSPGPDADPYVRSAEYVVGALPASPYAARTRNDDMPIADASES